MTKLLEKALSKAGELPEPEQDAIAQIVLDEIESEKLWDDRFAKSTAKLRKLADQAWAEHEAGGSEELGPDRRLEIQKVAAICGCLVRAD